MSERTALATYCQGLDEIADQYEEPLRSHLKSLSKQVLAAFEEVSDEVRDLRKQVAGFETRLAVAHSRIDQLEASERDSSDGD